MRPAVLGCLLAGCLFENRHPDLRISSPTTGDRITGHDAVQIGVAVDDVDVEDFALRVDGEVVSDFSVSPSPEGRRCSPCQFTITWAASTVREGRHVISVHALESNDIRASDGLELAFDDTPEIVGISPDPDADLTGVGTLAVGITVIERGTATVDLELDGTPFATRSNSDCNGSGCAFQIEVDTSALAPGPHELHATVSDGNGHVTEDTRTITVDDMIKVTSLQVTATSEGGILEIEVYVFDDTTNELLGCAGSANGTGPVDASDVHYVIDAHLIHVSGGRLLRGDDLAGRSIRFEVWEDDDDPVCPVFPAPAGNDLVGKSAGQTVAAWKDGASPAAFGNVVELAYLIGRPL
jgi:hypothetical protein